MVNSYKEPYQPGKSGGLGCILICVIPILLLFGVLDRLATEDAKDFCRELLKEENENGKNK